MTRHDQEFQVEYAYWLEHMLNTFWRRVDACINIALIVLGTSIAATLNIDIFIGLSVAILAAINVVIQPLRKAISADTQANKYSEILATMHTLKDNELGNHIAALRETNSEQVGMLIPLAFNRAAIKMQMTPNYEYTLVNRAAGHFIGDTPTNKV
ncbi:hypothetical protein [Vibrio sp. 10N.261.51.F12]|uniref:hypothetical protein n=1 Tax=Vibrio sp. 10N.261.51.F12 TaxID=3229679 RepID=UPI00354B36BC